MRGAAGGIQRLSRPASLRLGTALGRVAYTFGARARRRAYANLRLAFGDGLDSAGQRRVARGVFEHFGRATVDFLRAPSLTPDALDREVTCEGWGNVETVLALGKGVILVTGHIGSWEVMGRWLATVKHLPVTVVAKQPRDAAFARYVRKMREGAGFAVLDRGDSVRDLLRALRGGGVVLLLSDQNSGDIFLPFFGVPAGTAVGPATIAARTGAPLVPIYSIQREDGSLHVTFEPAIPIDSTADKSREVARVTGCVNASLEAMIRRYPEQWLWLHDRWKAAFDEKNYPRAWSDRAAFESARAAWLS